MVLINKKQKRQVVIEVTDEKVKPSEHGFFKRITRRSVLREYEADVLATVDNDEIERVTDLAFKSEEGWASNGMLLVRVLNRAILFEETLP